MMKTQPFNLLNHYTSFNILFQAINIFAYSQDYAVVKNRIKVSKKGVLRKAVLMCDQNKKYHTKSWNKRETATQKTDYPFNTLVILEVDG